MSKKDFDTLVENVIKQRSSLAVMRPVVEKEILHYDIFKALSGEGLLDAHHCGYAEAQTDLAKI